MMEYDEPSLHQLSRLENDKFWRLAFGAFGLRNKQVVIALPIRLFWPKMGWEWRVLRKLWHEKTNKKHDWYKHVKVYPAHDSSCRGNRRKSWRDRYRCTFRANSSHVKKAFTFLLQAQEMTPKYPLLWSPYWQRLLPPSRRHYRQNRRRMTPQIGPIDMRQICGGDGAPPIQSHSHGPTVRYPALLAPPWRSEIQLAHLVKYWGFFRWCTVSLQNVPWSSRLLRLIQQ